MPEAQEPHLETPPRAAIGGSLIEKALTQLDEQARALREGGTLRASQFIDRASARLAELAREGAKDLATTSASDAADRLGISERTVVRRIQRGDLEGRKIGGEWIVLERSLADQPEVRRGAT